tara:strand:- start:28 stop:381 length:354 start_codon:yes stop_codon:yes gene_type:complete
MSTLSKALYALGIDGGWKIKEGKIVKWWADKPQPSDEAIQTKLAELRAEEPMRLLRKERDIRLSEVDWWTSRATDGIELTQAQKDYRKALRDLPSTSSPKLDDNDNLTNVTWPTKPS